MKEGQGMLMTVLDFGLADGVGWQRLIHSLLSQPSMSKKGLTAKHISLFLSFFTGKLCILLMSVPL
jgi:hypothetical protein